MTQRATGPRLLFLGASSPVSQSMCVPSFPLTPRAAWASHSPTPGLPQPLLLASVTLPPALTSILPLQCLPLSPFACNLFPAVILVNNPMEAPQDCSGRLATCSQEPGTSLPPLLSLSQPQCLQGSRMRSRVAPSWRGQSCLASRGPTGQSPIKEGFGDHREDWGFYHESRKSRQIFALGSGIV